MARWKSIQFFRQFSTLVENTLQDAKQSKNLLQVSWKNAEVKSYPLVWLRDNCQCNQCFHPVSKSRTIMMLDFNPRPELKSFQISDGKLNLEWSDGHNSTFNGDWLSSRGFDQFSQQKRTEQVSPSKKFWFGDFKTSIPRANFHHVLEHDSVFVSWLQNMQAYGISVLENAPCKQGQVRKLADKIGFIKKTHYGEEFQVQAKEDPNNVAYTSSELQLHTDLPYYEYKPGVNMLHCIVQDTTSGLGGENQLADGFGVAQKMKEKFPEAYKVLSTTLVDWSDIGKEGEFAFHKVHRSPVFCEDPTGKLYRVNYSQPQRDSYFPGPLDAVQDWYDALKLFCVMLYSEENLVRIKLNPGEILTFDNRRIIHGRSAFGGNRHVEGAYVDWDEVSSRLKVLTLKE